MNPAGYDINYQWGFGNREIPDKYHFAATIRDITGIDAWYPVKYDNKSISIVEFKIAEAWQNDIQKYGYWWELKYNDGIIASQLTISDIWTAKERLMEHLGLSRGEINDVMYAGRSRFDMNCEGCPANHVEKKMN